MPSKSLVGALATLSLIASSTATYDADSPANLAVYWGAVAGQEEVGYYCKQSTIDIINVAFIEPFPQQNSGGLPGENFGNQCYATPTYPGSDGTLPENCPLVQEDIPFCQKVANKKIVLSIGGGTSTYQLTGEQAGIDFATLLWQMYGPYNQTYVAGGGIRPLDRSSTNTALDPYYQIDVDGFDFDIEVASLDGAAGYIAMIQTLRSLFATNPAKTYVITGAPQCNVPDAIMDAMIQGAEFDALYVQFYNTPDCSARKWVAGNSALNTSGTVTTAGFTYDDWITRTASGASKNAKIYLGLLGSPSGSTSAPGDFLWPEEAYNLIHTYITHERFGGVQLWDATWANGQQVDYEGYSGNYYGFIKSVLSSYTPKIVSTTSSSSSASQTSTTASETITTPDSSSSSVIFSSAPISSPISSSSSTSSESSVPTSLPSSCQSLGCWTEGANGVRALPNDHTIDHTLMSSEICYDFCVTQNGYPYFGLEYAGECWCGDVLDATSMNVADSFCSLPCDGTPGELCGGLDVLDVYHCSAGPETSTTGSSQPTASSTSSSSTTTSQPSSTVIPTTSSSSSISSTSSSSSISSTSSSSSISSTSSSTSISSTSSVITSTSSIAGSTTSISSSASATTSPSSISSSQTSTYSSAGMTNSSSTSASPASTTSKSVILSTGYTSSSLSSSQPSVGTANSSSVTSSSTSKTIILSTGISSSSSVLPTSSSSSSGISRSSSSSSGTVLPPFTNSSSIVSSTKSLSGTKLSSSTVTVSASMSSSSLTVSPSASVSSSSLPGPKSTLSSTTSKTGESSVPPLNKSLSVSKSSGLSGSSSSSPQYTTSTVRETKTYTITSCAATVTNCPAKIGQVTTETIDLYTTICPVTASEGTSGETKAISTPVLPVGPSSTPMTTSTVYSTKVYTITSCAPSVTNCPAKIGSVTTEIISLYTTICPVTASASESTKPSTSTIPTLISGSPSGKSPIASSTPITSTIYSTKIYTLTSCAPSITNCPAKIGSLTTEILTLYTTAFSSAETINSLPGGVYQQSSSVPESKSSTTTVQIVKSTATLIPTPVAPYPTGSVSASSRGVIGTGTGTGKGVSTGFSSRASSVGYTTTSAVGGKTSSPRPSVFTGSANPRKIGGDGFVIMVVLALGVALIV